MRFATCTAQGRITSVTDAGSAPGGPRRPIPGARGRHGKLGLARSRALSQLQGYNTRAPARHSSRRGSR